LGEHPAIYGYGWICGAAHDYNRECYADLFQLSILLRNTQPGIADALLPLAGKKPPATPLSGAPAGRNLQPQSPGQ